jgi:hypothetical protein
VSDTHRTDALRFAKEFASDPDKRAQVKVQLCANGWPQLADMIDEAVTVSREMLRITDELADALKAKEEAVSLELERCAKVCDKARSENKVTELMAENIIEKAAMAGAVKQAEKLADAIRAIDAARKDET